MTFEILSKLSRGSRRMLALLGAPALLLVLASCGGGSSMGGGSPQPQGCNASSCGTAMITMTDAPGDFTSYTVSVTSLQLKRADGAVVETMPVATSVDLTQLVNLTEIISATTIPLGDYVSATVTVDYTHASVWVDDSTNTPVQATLVDASGQPLTTLTLNVQFDSSHHFVVSPGLISRLALDFNLAASNAVDLTKTPQVVTVQPFIAASVVPSDTKSIRVRGSLVSVDTMAGTYVVNVHPFEDGDGGGDGMGQVTVNTTAQTTFEINGTPSMGTAGVTALAALPAGTWTVAFGTVSTTDHSFTASQVLAGSSVQSASMDRLSGVVVARSGNSLTVRTPSEWMHTDSDDHFVPKNVTLTIGTGTTVTVDGQPTAMPTIAWPSVGSVLTAFGTAGTDSSGNPTFDATAGRVRLETSTIWGFPSATASNQVTLNLQSLDGLAPSNFTFTGTGMTSAQDSNPAAYVVSIGTLPPPPVSASTPARFLGLVQPYGTAPPDFNANTLVNFSAAIALLNVSFGDGSADAFSTISSSELVINLADPLLGSTHSIRIGPSTIDLKSLPSSPMIVPDPAAAGMYAIVGPAAAQMDSTSVYQTYPAFEMALSSMLSGSGKVVRVLATGQFDATSNTFTAVQIAVVVH